ncbi:MAG: hypothetical protein AB1426_00240 [Bacillota bacterium]
MEMDYPIPEPAAIVVIGGSVGGLTAATSETPLSGQKRLHNN